MQVAGDESTIGTYPRSLLATRDSRLALIDVREHGEYNAAHIPGASSVPRRQLEFRMARLVPFRGVQVVVCDDDGQRAALAARTLGRMGYSRAIGLDGGLNRWASEGLPTEWGMNVPSKEFGELVEVRHQVPTSEARELERWIERGEEVVILDARTPEEYGRFCIPGGRSVPGGELALRISDIAIGRPNARIVVNCAGRTRSIIGARTLQRMGLLNVVSLRNGTSGWLLAGFQLEQGASQVDLPEPSAEARTRAEEFAARLATEDGVRYVSVDQLQSLLSAVDEQTIYLIDVRTEREFVEGHIPGFWWFPGGQAVQRADDLVAVRDAQIVFCCDGKVRATVTASWFRQMGFPNVYVVDGGTATWANKGLSLETGLAELEPFGLREAAAQVPILAPAQLAARLSAKGAPRTIFVDTSKEFAAGHVPGSRWLPRGWLELRVEQLGPDPSEPLIATDVDGRGALLAAATLKELGYRDVAALGGGIEAWRQAGLPLERGLAGVMEPPDDVVPSGPDRSYADMVHYLRWEEALGQKYEPTPAERAALNR